MKTLSRGPWSAQQFDDQNDIGARRLLIAFVIAAPTLFVFRPIINPFLFTIIILLAFSLLLAFLPQMAWRHLRWLRFPDRIVARTPVFFVLTLIIATVFTAGLGVFLIWVVWTGGSFSFLILGVALLAAVVLQAYRMRGLVKNGARFEITLTPDYLQLQAIDGQTLRAAWNDHPELGPFDAQHMCIYNDATGPRLLYRALLPIRATDLHDIIDYYSLHADARWELAAPTGLDRIVDICNHTSRTR